MFLQLQHIVEYYIMLHSVLLCILDEKTFYNLLKSILRRFAWFVVDKQFVLSENERVKILLFPKIITVEKHFS